MAAVLTGDDRQFDCVIVPGGGLGAAGQPLPWVAARLDAALKHESETAFFLVLSRGTTHKPPPLDSAGFPVDESAASARYLVERGVDPSRVLLESWSLDTIGNAAFARLMHSDIRGWRRLLVITSASHMARTQRIFNWVFSLPPGREAQAALAAARRPNARERAQQKRQERRGQQFSLAPEPPVLEYEEVDDGSHLEAEQLTERRRKEASALEKLEQTTSQITDLAMLHEFLFAKHDAYRASTKDDDARREGERAKGALAASY